jgi:hypothetical protein
MPRVPSKGDGRRSVGAEIVMRVHRVRAEVVVAACDADLIGRELPVGTKGRTVPVTAFFYGERKVSEEELVWALKRATTANLLGPKVLAIATEAGFVGPEGIGELGGVPHAEIFAMSVE